MNQLDAVFLIGALLAGLGGWRLGLIRRVTGWIGLLVGTVVASRLLPTFFPTPDSPDPFDLIKRLAVIFACGIVGQGVGHIVGGRVRAMINVAKVGVVDSAGGAVLGVGGIVLAAWMLIPTMVQIPGWPADAARGSAVAARLTRALGEPPDLLAGVGKSLGVDGLSDALENVKNLNIDPEAPNTSSVPDDVVAQVRRSVVKLSGPACDRLQSGSGFVIAPGLVATNAHVVAGSESLTISGDDLDVPGTIRFLDLRNDIALVAAPDLDRPPLDLVEPEQGAVGAVLGYPGGGPLKVQPYIIAAESTATSRDIYDRDRFQRTILILGSEIGPGDSGGPLVDPEGKVAGIAFGIAPDHEEMAYAIPSSLLRELAAQAAPEPIGSGACRNE